LLKETVAESHMPVRDDGDPAREAPDTPNRTGGGHSPVRALNPRVAVGFSQPQRTTAEPAARRMRDIAGRAGATSARMTASSARRRRIESPERLVPILVAVFLGVATLTAVPSAFGASKSSASDVSTTRLVIGGEQGPNTGAAVGVDSIDGPDAAALIDGAAGGEVATTGDAATIDVAGQFLDDGTLLKPVVVDTSISTSQDRLRTYKVRSGDTLTGIARRMGVSMMTIWWANKLTSKDALHIGQTLVIPPVDGLVVTVSEGDTLQSIADSKNLDPDEVAAYNKLADTTLVIGQVLILPGAHGKAIPTPKPTKRPVVRVIPVHSSTGHHVSTPSRPITPPPSHYSGGALAWPVPGGHISQYYSGYHPAIDIAAPSGTPIVAAAGGTVIYAGWRNNGGGYQVWISHGSNLYTTYNHMSSVSVGVGQRVGRGQFVGRVGSTGRSTGPHCHFEVWRGPVWSGGTRVNPLAYL
jgi:murein DD-endopeptidase MepM/ murein hydrolase activator NlpD